MDYHDPNHGSRIRVVLTDDELQLGAIEDLCNKYYDWLKLFKETTGGRKTRAANRRVDSLYDEIMAYKMPPINLNPISPIKNHCDDASETSSLESSGQATRTLRPRSRTPSVTRQKQQIATPSTPTQQSIRAHMKKNLDSGSSSVLSAALNQQHPSVSVTKIRQLLRADSAQKKRDEEQERQDRLRLDRKAKEERAEAQKKQLLEERAITAKVKREQRLLHAAEVRKQRAQKLKEEQRKKQITESAETNNSNNNAVQKQQQEGPQETKLPNPHHTNQQKQQQLQQPQQQQPQSQIQQQPQSQQHQQSQSKQQPQPPVTATTDAKDATEPLKLAKMDETFKKPSNDQNNIDISVHDETKDSHKTKDAEVASWAKAPHLRDAIIAQFSKTETELINIRRVLFAGLLKLPVDLDKIFGPGKAVNNRYLCRTSSAVWSPPNRALKRTSSMVMTPTNQSKR